MCIQRLFGIATRDVPAVASFLSVRVLTWRTLSSRCFCRHGLVGPPAHLVIRLLCYCFSLTRLRRHSAGQAPITRTVRKALLWRWQIYFNVDEFARTAAVVPASTATAPLY